MIDTDNSLYSKDIIYTCVLFEIKLNEHNLKGEI